MASRGRTSPRPAERLKEEESAGGGNTEGDGRVAWLGSGRNGEGEGEEACAWPIGAGLPRRALRSELPMFCEMKTVRTADGA